MTARTRIALLAAALTAVAAATPASANEVTVSLSNPGGNRTLYVEDLLGQPLTTLDLGTTRAHPFRVRVVDTTMDRSGFQVLTKMSNLYKASGQSYDFDATISSANVSVEYAATPLNVLSPSAVVAPVYNLSETVTGALCTTIESLGGSCSILLSSVEGVRQTVTLPVDLGNLLNLPLVPQEGESGPFTSPDFSGVGANDPDKPSSYTPTNRRVLSGGVSIDATLMDALSAALAAQIAGQSAGDLVAEGTLTGGLREALGGTVYDALLPADVQALIDGLQASLVTPVAANVVGQTGTYMSFPSLKVNVPSTASAGTYKGTLVVTAVQL